MIGPVRKFGRELAKSGKCAVRAFHSSKGAQSRIYDSILDTIGNTPIVKLNNLGPKDVNLYVKCEYFNPLSSVKDRLALAVIEDAEKSGALKPGMTVVEATSGNTGIALAMVCAQKGYPCVITMAETFSVERRKVMRMLGAKVILTPAAEKGTGMVKKAQELAKEHGWFEPRQFENQANALYHASTTGPEILSAFASLGLDYWVGGYGTGGTFQGVGRVFRQASPKTKIILAEPTLAPLMSSGVKQERNADGSPTRTHPAFQPHPVQGWTPDFIPKLAEDGASAGCYDELVLVEGPKAIAASHALAQKEGIFTGISGGASMAAALEVAEKAEKGANIVAMLADTAERYLSTPLFAEIEADMNEEEKKISASTPNFQL